MNSPGIDKIPNFWISSLIKGHEKLASLLSEIVRSPVTSPKWLSEVITYLSPKTKYNKNPTNYRPDCLFRVSQSIASCSCRLEQLLCLISQTLFRLPVTKTLRSLLQ